MNNKVLILMVCLVLAVVMGWSALGVASSEDVQTLGKTAACQCDPCKCDDCKCEKPSCGGGGCGG